MAYSACDLFVGPSLDECFGQVFVEAAACGLPAIGYPVGGVPEAVTDGITGLVAAAPTPEALAEVILRLHQDTALRAALSGWAPILVGNERTLESSYHSLHLGLRLGLKDGAKVMGRKIAFRPLGFAQPAGGGANPSQYFRLWRAIDGFGPWEGPYPALGVGRGRWQQQAQASFLLISAASGLHDVTLRFRNLSPDQHLQLWTDDTLVFRGPVARNGGAEATSLTLRVWLRSSRTHWRCVGSSWVTSEEGRELFVFMSSIEAMPVPDAPVEPRGRPLMSILRDSASRLMRMLER